MPIVVWWLLGGAALGTGGTLLISDGVKKAAKYTAYAALAYGAFKYGPAIIKAVKK